MANIQRVFSNSDLDHPLTDLGCEQVHAVANYLSSFKIEMVYSSPVKRAVQTAQIIANRLQSPCEKTNALWEWNVGEYEGTSDPAGWDLHRKVQEDWFYHQKLDSKMPGGESFLEIRERFVPFIEGLLHNGENAHREIAIVAHGGLYLAMLPAILTNVDFTVAEQGFPYTGCVIAEPRPTGLFCTSWCGVTLE